MLLAFIMLLFFGVKSVTEDANNWVDNHTQIYSELEELLVDFKDAEIRHQAYIITGETSQLKAFNNAIKSINDHLSAIRNSNERDLKYTEKFLSLENKINNALDRLRMSTSVRSNKNKNAPLDKGLLLTSREAKEVEEVGHEIAETAGFEQKMIAIKTKELSVVFDYVRIFAGLASLVLLGTILLMVRAGAGRYAEAESKIKSLEIELTKAKQQLDRSATVDYLTEVHNIKGFEQLLAVEQNRVARSGGQLVAVLANCDNFKQISEQLGHTVSNVVLKEMAERIVATLRPSDHVARLYGDEFLILLTDTQLAYAMRVAERIRKAISESPLRGTPKPLTVTASIGVAGVGPNVTSVDEILSVARGALRRSKTSGKNRVSLSRDGTKDSEMEGTRDILDLLSDGAHFRVVYQPIIDLLSERIAGYEIFSRGPDGAFESPAEFFRISSENDILTNVDLLCLRHCIAATNSIAKNLRFHINLFPSTIIETSVEVLLSLFPTDRKGKTFCIEISEKNFAGDPGYLKDQINTIREAGILVAIDDVGYGRSSLESLILLEPDLVKVDRKYVTNVGQDVNKTRLLKRVVNVAKSLGAEVVAEGIESELDLPILREIGVHYGQGYYWGALLEVLPEQAAPTIPTPVLNKEER